MRRRAASRAACVATGGESDDKISSVLVSEIGNRGVAVVLCGVSELYRCTWGNGEDDGGPPSVRVVVAFSENYQRRRRTMTCTDILNNAEPQF